MKELLLVQGGLFFALLTGYAQSYRPSRHTGFTWWTGRRRASFGTDSVSPDKQWVAVVRDNNVYIRAAVDDGSAAVAYTCDGSADRPYGQLHDL